MNNQKVALITGASSGLGRELAYIFAENNYNLVLTARDIKQLEITKKNCLKKAKNTNPIIILVTADLENINNLDNVIETAIGYFDKLDLLVNNAGLSMWELNKNLTFDEHKKIFNINYFACIYLINKALPYLRDSRGTVLTISSAQSFLAVPYHTAYVASKHALNGFIKTIRLEEPDVKFVLSMPGWIDGTNLRVNAIGPEHKVGAKKRRIATVSCEKVALDCYNSVINKKLNIYSPGYLKILHISSQLVYKIIDFVMCKIFKLS